MRILKGRKCFFVRRHKILGIVIDVVFSAIVVFSNPKFTYYFKNKTCFFIPTKAVFNNKRRAIKLAKKSRDNND